MLDQECVKSLHILMFHNLAYPSFYGMKLKIRTTVPSTILTQKWYKRYFLKGVFAKNERGYRLTVEKLSLVQIATNLTSMIYLFAYKEKTVEND